MTIIETMDRAERGMNPVAVTIINPLERILAEPEVRTSNLLFSSLLHYRRSLSLSQMKALFQIK